MQGQFSDVEIERGGKVVLARHVLKRIANIKALCNYKVENRGMV